MIKGEPRAVMIPIVRGLHLLKLIADRTDEIEAVSVADVLTRIWNDASVGRKKQNIVTMSQDTKVQGDIAIEACEDLIFDLIMCPGQKRQGRYYCGICAAPAVDLIPHGLLDSGPATTYPNYGSKMTGVDYMPDKVKSVAQALVA
ncbi:hypothetical protein PHMEG_00017982 [Phytophthora megakarya]|uniref:Uncharacterized protein n=1 Tax=Phytophthora megakarya TaxID=4795 RepID=A0A225VVG3_9STRA|nr:hypothetical protein PHMEG_00017982 [Phytophthora megakarya]